MLELVQAAQSVATPPTALLVEVAELRSEVNLGGDTTFDTELTEALNAAQEWLTKRYGSGIMPSSRTDYFRCFGQHMRLKRKANITQPLTVTFQPGNSTFSALTNPITAIAVGQKCFYDESAGDYGVVSLTLAGIEAAAAAELSPYVVNPVKIVYESAGITGEGFNVLKLAVKKMAAALYGEQATEPSMTAKAIAEDLLDTFAGAAGMGFSL